MRTTQPISANIANGCFRFSHTLWRNHEFSVIQFIFEFHGVATLNALVNPTNTPVRSVLSKMVTCGECSFFLIDAGGAVAALRPGPAPVNVTELRADFPVINSATTTEHQYERMVAGSTAGSSRLARVWTGSAAAIAKFSLSRKRC